MGWIDHDWLNGRCRRCLVALADSEGRACPGIALSDDELRAECNRRWGEDDCPMATTLRAERDEMKRLHDIEVGRRQRAEAALEAYRQAETREIPNQWRRNAHAAVESGPGLSAKAPGAAQDYHWVDPLDLLADDA